ncbi:MAG: type-F conjugative transfer system secretin TraK [Simkaniaceae bacterium]|nr:type-F conjugative transfer system secretin TraK [Simkaniaceae bacterium]
MLKRVAVIASLHTCLIGSPEASVVRQPLDESNVIRVTVSERHHNVLHFKEGKIKQVTADPRFFDFRINETYGQALFAVKQPLPTAQAVSVLVSSGQVQNFLISGGEEEPTIIFLEDEEEEPHPIPSEETLIAPRDIAMLLRGEEPEGFHKRDLDEGETFTFQSSLFSLVEKVSVFEGPTEKVFVVRLENRKGKAVTVDPRFMKGAKTSWVIALDKTLRQRERTTVILSERKGGSSGV